MNRLENVTKRFDDLLETLSVNKQENGDNDNNSNLPIPADVANKTQDQLQLLIVSIRQKNEMLQRQYKSALSKVEQVQSDLKFAKNQVASLKAQVDVVRSENVEIEKKYKNATQKAQDEAIVYKENNTQLRTTIHDLRIQVATLDQQATESKASVEPLTGNDAGQRKKKKKKIL